MFGGNFKLIINYIYHRMEVEIYGQEIQGDHIYIIGYDGECLISQELKREDEMKLITEFKPLLKVGIHQFDSIVKAFVEVANEKQIHTEGESVLQGKLTATETHLADMREMSKKLVDTLIKKVK
jgi:hypothetical protein